MKQHQHRGRGVTGAVFSCVMAVVLFAVAGCDQHRTAQLVRSIPSAVNRPADLATMEWAIETALAKHHWVVREHVANRYTAHLTERAHQVDIAIPYDERGFAIEYVNSSNLLYGQRGDGTETIHRKYLTWAKNLAEGIRTHQAQAGMPGGPPRPKTVASPPPPTTTQVR